MTNSRANKQWVSAPYQTNQVTATGVVTPTGTMQPCDTEASASTDDIDTITPAKYEVLIICRSAASARDPTFKDSVDNLKMEGDFTCTDSTDFIMFYAFTSTNIIEISRSNNA